MAKYVLAVTVIVCVALLGAANAQEKTQQQKQPEKTTEQKSKEKAAPPKTLEQPPQQQSEQQTQKTALAQPAGDVVSIDTMKNELVIKDNAGVETHILITASTTITRGGKTITLADIKAGDKITSECEDTADGFKAKTITVTPAPAN